MNYAKLLPIGSYIDALNQSPKNLAHFLRYLDKNDELYNNYFKVKMRLKKRLLFRKKVWNYPLFVWVFFICLKFFILFFTEALKLKSRTRQSKFCSEPRCVGDLCCFSGRLITTCPPSPGCVVSAPAWTPARSRSSLPLRCSQHFQYCSQDCHDTTRHVVKLTGVVAP